MIDYCDAKVTRSQLGRITKDRAMRDRHLSAVVVWYNPRHVTLPDWDGMSGRIYRQINDARYVKYSRDREGRPVMNPSYDESLHWPNVVAACLTFEKPNDALAFYMTHSPDFLAAEFMDSSGKIAYAA